MNPLHFMILAACLAFTSSCSHRKPSEEVVSETYIHKYGLAMPREEWADQGKNGKVVTTRTDGVTVTSSYEKGRLHGETSYTFPFRTNIAKVELYDQDRLIREEEFYLSGQPKRQYDYELSLVKHYYEQGTLRCMEQSSDALLIRGKYYAPNEQVESIVENGEGLMTLRDDFGQLNATCKIVEGQVTERTTFHQNGMPKTVEPFQKGLVHGIRKTFQPSGEPLSVECWEEGAPNGVTTLFEQGEKIAEVPYVGGRKNGLECRFINEHEIVEEINWKDDVRHGPSKRFVEGQVITDWYVNGNKVSKIVYDQHVLGYGH